MNTREPVCEAHTRTERSQNNYHSMSIARRQIGEGGGNSRIVWRGRKARRIQNLVGAQTNVGNGNGALRD